MKGLIEEHLETPIIPTQSKTNLSPIIEQTKKEKKERDKAPKCSIRISTISVEQEVDEIRVYAPLTLAETEGEEEASKIQQF